MPITDPKAIAFINSIETIALVTSLSQQPILTTYIHKGAGGTPILLLHGFDSSILEFRFLLPLLATQNETWAVDLLGFGFTQRQKQIKYSPDTIKIHLYEFWTTLINQPIVLVGASMGGATAIDFTLTYPEVVKSLVLINSLGYTGAPTFSKYLFPPFDFFAVEYLRQRHILALNISSIVANLAPEIPLAIQCAMLHQEMPLWHDAMISYVKTGGYSNLANKIAQVDKPTLILWGEADDMLPSKDAEKFQQNIANSKLIKLKNCGHAPQIEQPEITFQHILQFLSHHNF
ncbi:2-hydroxy-6-oxohepta-2,4-dienoate hydrolase [Tolypothrix tenuis PCC 7101]|uniref:2-hydroxy-6-oxohepta-2,4-dienoate hydrolase n=1 Tax=Tolypothrix tenuis PCC 7101 TaxID=231146 RepID=A0A1Z4NAE7_9CYAN|nr:alpha/beta hydrolase [Aulosira sp. FACHB-113]BAZ02680.1 2-hydroxy-6-oxohepta-2,4-dienoate hydrolase [Tolypothrix tenuis PCC 7101]BAZ78427.1 2-hydroxy-6-oxohepta-2,4-dienoate hydrolase [Aulosira laxa NIES-50]